MGEGTRTQRRIDECNSHPIMQPLNADVRLATFILLQQTQSATRGGERDANYVRRKDKRRNDEKWQKSATELREERK